MGNTPREKALYISGFTLGTGLGILILGALFWHWGFGDMSSSLTAIIVGVLLVVISFVWKGRANSAKK